MFLAILIVLVAPLGSALADRCRPCDPGVEGWCEDFDDDALYAYAEDLSPFMWLRPLSRSRGHRVSELYWYPYQDPDLAEPLPPMPLPGEQTRSSATGLPFFDVRLRPNGTAAGSDLFVRVVRRQVFRHPDDANASMVLYRTSPDEPWQGAPVHALEADGDVVTFRLPGMNVADRTFSVRFQKAGFAAHKRRILSVAVCGADVVSSDPGPSIDVSVDDLARTAVRTTGVRLDVAYDRVIIPATRSAAPEDREWISLALHTHSPPDRDTRVDLVIDAEGPADPTTERRDPSTLRERFLHALQGSFDGRHWFLLTPQALIWHDPPGLRVPYRIPGSAGRRLVFIRLINHLDADDVPVDLVLEDIGVRDGYEPVDWSPGAPPMGEPLAIPDLDLGGAAVLRAAAYASVSAVPGPPTGADPGAGASSDDLIEMAPGDRLLYRWRAAAPSRSAPAVTVTVMAGGENPDAPPLSCRYSTDHQGSWIASTPLAETGPETVDWIYTLSDATDYSELAVELACPPDASDPVKVIRLRGGSFEPDPNLVRYHPDAEPYFDNWASWQRDPERGGTGSSGTVRYLLHNPYDGQLVVRDVVLGARALGLGDGPDGSGWVHPDTARARGLKVAWWEIAPAVLPPGGVSQITIRMGGVARPGVLVDTRGQGARSHIEVTSPEPFRGDELLLVLKSDLFGPPTGPDHTPAPVVTYRFDDGEPHAIDDTGNGTIGDPQAPWQEIALPGAPGARSVRVDFIEPIEDVLVLDPTGRIPLRVRAHVTGEGELDLVTSVRAQPGGTPLPLRLADVSYAPGSNTLLVYFHVVGSLPDPVRVWLEGREITPDSLNPLTITIGDVHLLPVSLDHPLEIGSYHAVRVQAGGKATEDRVRIFPPSVVTGVFTQRALYTTSQTPGYAGVLAEWNGRYLEGIRGLGTTLWSPNRLNPAYGIFASAESPSGLPPMAIVSNRWPNLKGPDAVRYGVARYWGARGADGYELARWEREGYLAGIYLEDEMEGRDIRSTNRDRWSNLGYFGSEMVARVAAARALAPSAPTVSSIIGSIYNLASTYLYGQMGDVFVATNYHMPAGNNAGQPFSAGVYLDFGERLRAAAEPHRVGRVVAAFRDIPSDTSRAPSRMFDPAELRLQATYNLFGGMKWVPVYEYLFAREEGLFRFPEVRDAWREVVEEVSVVDSLLGIGFAVSGGSAQASGTVDSTIGVHLVLAGPDHLVVALTNDDFTSGPAAFTFPDGSGEVSGPVTVTLPVPRAWGEGTSPGVVVDGVRPGWSPRRVELTPGSEEITVELPGFVVTAIFTVTRAPR